MSPGHRGDDDSPPQVRTPDMGGYATCRDFTEAVIDALPQAHPYKGVK